MCTTHRLLLRRGKKKHFTESKSLYSIQIHKLTQEAFSPNCFLLTIDWNYEADFNLCNACPWIRCESIVSFTWNDPKWHHHQLKECRTFCSRTEIFCVKRLQVTKIYCSIEKKEYNEPQSQSKMKENVKCAFDLTYISLFPFRSR